MAATPVTLNRVDHKTAMVKPTAVACDATNGNSVPNSGRTILEMNNTGASTYTVSVAFANTVDGQTVPPLSYSIAAGATRVAGGWPVNLYGATLIFTAENAAVTVCAYEV